jgi:hypothetical protein
MYDCFYVFKLDCFWIFNFSDINPKGLWLKNTLQMKHCVFHVYAIFWVPPTRRDKRSDTLVEPSVLWSSPPPVGISEATLWSCAPYGISGATLWSCAPEGGTLIR